MIKWTVDIPIQMVYKFVSDYVFPTCVAMNRRQNSQLNSAIGIYGKVPMGSDAIQTRWISIR